MATERFYSLSARLHNLSSRNRLLFQAAIRGRHGIDFRVGDFENGLSSEDSLAALFCGQKSKLSLGSVLDPRDEGANKWAERLRLLLRESDLLQAEQGTNDLYLAFPFVHGCLKDDTFLRAPLILWPVTIYQDKNTWWIEKLSDQPEWNPVLRTAVLYHLGTSMPAWPEWPQENFEDLRALLLWLYKILEEQEWPINFNSDLFSERLIPFSAFKKADMATLWGQGELKLMPEAVLGLYPLTDGALQADWQWMEGNFSRLEEIFHPFERPNLPLPRREDTLYPLPTDGPQERALLRIRRGESLVIQGPPGTGKSQLITNAIADSIGRGKRVLVVCQKKAALEVIKNRLSELGAKEFFVLASEADTIRASLFPEIAAQVEQLESYRKEALSWEVQQQELDHTRYCRNYDEQTSYWENYRDFLWENNPISGVPVADLYLKIRSWAEVSAIQLPKALAKRMTFNEWERLWPQVRTWWKLISQLQIKTTLEEEIFRSGEINPETVLGLVVQNSDEKRFSALLNSIKQYGSFDAIENKLLECKEILQHKALLQQMSGRGFVGREQFLIRAYENEGRLRQQYLQDEEFKPLGWGRNEWLVIYKCLPFWGAIEQGLQRWWISLVGGEKKNLLKELQSLRPVGMSWPEFLNLGLRYHTYISQRDRLLIELRLEELKEEFSLKPLIESLNIFEGVSGNELRLAASENEETLKTEVELLSRQCEAINQWGKQVPKSYWTFWLKELQNNSFRWEDIISVQKAYSRLEFQQFVKSLASQQVLRETFCELAICIIQENISPSNDYQEDEKSFLKGIAQAQVSVAAQAYEAGEWGEKQSSTPSGRTVFYTSEEQIFSSLEHWAIASERRHKSAEVLLISRLQQNCLNKIQLNRLGNAVTFRGLAQQVRKKRNRLTVRQLVEFHGEELFTLRPCWLVSPEVAATFFPMETKFDLVLFDEASQCYAEKAIPLMPRAQQIVVVGDRQQLPPNNLYQTRVESDTAVEGDDKFSEEAITESLAEQADSLLDMAELYLESSMLQAHYRSANEALIGFSNTHFYGGQLLALPKRPVQMGAFAYHYIEEGRWQRRINTQEAEALLSYLLKELPQWQAAGLSVGIITFNFPQMDYILTRLDELRRDWRGGIWPEDLLVRNIENIQGEERDIWLMSLGYAKDNSGKYVRNFGSLSTNGGEKRLNVAVTRARLHYAVFASIYPHELLGKEGSGTIGARLLQEWLQKVWDYGKVKENESNQGEIDTDANKKLVDVVRAIQDKSLVSQQILHGPETLKKRGFEVQWRWPETELSQFG